MFDLASDTNAKPDIHFVGDRTAMPTNTKSSLERPQRKIARSAIINQPHHRNNNSTNESERGSTKSSPTSGGSSLARSIQPPLKMRSAMHIPDREPSENHSDTTEKFSPAWNVIALLSKGQHETLLKPNQIRKTPRDPHNTSVLPQYRRPPPPQNNNNPPSTTRKTPSRSHLNVRENEDEDPRRPRRKSLNGPLSSSGGKVRSDEEHLQDFDTSLNNFNLTSEPNAYASEKKRDTEDRKVSPRKSLSLTHTHLKNESMPQPKSTSPRREQLTISRRKGQSCVSFTNGNTITFEDRETHTPRFHQSQRRSPILQDLHRAESPPRSDKVPLALSLVFRSSFFVLRSSFFVLRFSFFVFRFSFFVLRSCLKLLNLTWHIFLLSQTLTQSWQDYNSRAKTPQTAKRGGSRTEEKDMEKDRDNEDKKVSFTFRVQESSPDGKREGSGWRSANAVGPRGAIFYPRLDSSKIRKPEAPPPQMYEPESLHFYNFRDLADAVDTSKPLRRSSSRVVLVKHNIYRSACVSRGPVDTVVWSLYFFIIMVFCRLTNVTLQSERVANIGFPQDSSQYQDDD